MTAAPLAPSAVLSPAGDVHPLAHCEFCLDCVATPLTVCAKPDCQRKAEQLYRPYRPSWNADATASSAELAAIKRREDV